MTQIHIIIILVVIIMWLIGFYIVEVLENRILKKLIDLYKRRNKLSDEIIDSYKKP